MIRLDLPIGTSAHEAVGEALRTSAEHGCVVRVDFNGYDLEVLPGDSYRQVMARFRRGYGARFSELEDAGATAELLREAALEFCPERRPTREHGLSFREYLGYVIWEVADGIEGGWLVRNDLHGVRHRGKERE